MRQKQNEVGNLSHVHIVEAKVERSLLCVAVGQVTLNLTLTVHRHEIHGSALRKRLSFAVLAFAALIGVSLPRASTAEEVAFSRDVPADLAKQFKPFSPIKATVDDGVLRVVLPKQIVRSKHLFSGVYLAYCSPTWDSKKAWGGRDFKRVEVVNSANTQGFAIAANKADCVKAGRMKDAQEERDFLKELTWVCVAGNPCRPRNPGEVTASDE